MKTNRFLLILAISITLLACNPPSSVESTVTDVSAAEPAQSKPIPPTETAEECVFSLGFDVWEPYQYVDISGQVVGLDVELIAAVVKDMGCDLSYQQDTWISSLDKLKDAQVDILLGASKTDTREEFAHFSISYRMEEFSLYIRKDDEKHAAYQSLDNFIENGSKIGIVDGYFYGPEVSILLDGTATSKYFVPGIMGELNVGRLLDGDIDGFLEDSFIGASILRRKGLSKYIVANGITLNTGEIYVMFSKQSVTPEQVAQFNNSLNKIKDSQQYEDIINKYSQ
ncbi:MAG: polar amino acid transport system substrate-binding protein [Paraglaciecola sp.]|jgi:polar amino acid transport system substrate-binding protein